MRDFLKIPKNRVGTLIGKKGETKQKIQKELDCRLKVSVEGDVEISSEDPLYRMKANEIVKAIGRGFGLKEAFDLLDDEYCLQIISMPEIIGKSRKTLKRFKARIIGREGYAKKHIGELTDTNIAVSGKTVSIIGKGNDVEYVREAILMILKGRKHASVFRYLEGIKNV